MRRRIIVPVTGADPSASSFTASFAAYFHAPSPFSGSVGESPAASVFDSLFGPDERALLRWLAPQVDGAALDEIAAGDYGFHTSEYREELSELTHSPWLPDTLPWNPGEVLTLRRSRRPADSRDHVIRMFVCMFLVRASTANADPADSLAPLVDSAFVLGGPAHDVTVSFVAWCRLNLPGDWPDDPSSPMFLTLALLLMSAPTGAAPALAAVLLAELDTVLTDPDLPWRRRPRSPLFTRRTSDDSATRRLWSDLVTRHLLVNPAVTDPRLTEVGRYLSGESTTPIADLRALFPGAASAVSPDRESPRQP